MLQFNNSNVILKRPISVQSVADSLEVRPYELMRDLIELEIFAVPPQKLEDVEIQVLGERIGITFRIDEDGFQTQKK